MKLHKCKRLYSSTQSHEKLQVPGSSAQGCSTILNNITVIVSYLVTKIMSSECIRPKKLETILGPTLTIQTELPLNLEILLRTV